VRVNFDLMGWSISVDH